MVKPVTASTMVLVLVVVASAFPPEAEAKKPKSVTATLDAKWAETPLLLEAAEFLWDESPAKFWGFVEDVARIEPESFLQKTDKEYYDLVLETAERYLTAGRVRLLKFALSLRYYSPRIEMFRQIAADRGVPKNCAAVVEINGVMTCDPGDIDRLVTSATSGSAAEVLQMDHRHPESDASSTTRAVLYAEPGSVGFQAFHDQLGSLATQRHVDYIFRPFVRDYDEADSRRVRLSGYGVELQMKSTEYKAQDDAKVDDEDRATDDEDKVDEIEGFVFSRLRELYPNKTGSIDKLKAHLLESNQEIAPLKVWQLQDLSLQAAERIKAAPKDEALSIMSQISQNFPLQARSLVRTAVRDELRKEVKKNQKIIQNEIGIQPSDAFLLVNGLTYDMDTIDPFSLLDSLKTEHKKMEGLHQLGLNQETVVKMLSLDIGKSKSTSSKGSPSYALDIRDTAVVYVNDIEKDPSYAKWPSQLLELLRPVFPGMLRSIRRNIFHLVLLVDPAEKTSAELVKIAESFYVHKAPIRIGFVLSVDPREEVTGNDDAGVAMLLGFNAVSSVKNAAAGLSFLTDVYAKAGADPVTPEIVREVMKRLRPKDNLDEIFGADSTYDYGRQLARDFISRTGLERLPQVLMNGIPLEQKHLNADGFEEGAIMALSSQMNVLQQAVYDGSLTDSDNVLDFLMRQPNVMPRLNNRILTGDNDEVKYVDASSLFSDPKDDDLTQKVFSNFPYFSSKSGSMGTKPVTVWLAVDVNNRQGLGIVRAAASHIAGDPNMRIGLLFNAEDVNNDRLAKAVLSVIQSQENRVAAEVLDAFLTDKNVKKFVEGNLEPVQLNVKGFDLLSYSKAFDALDMSSILNLHRQYSSKMLNVRPGQAVVICNGRVIGPLGAKEDFVESDFLLLSRYVSSTSADAIIQMLLEVKAQGKQGRTLSDYVVGATTVLLSQGAAKSRLELPALVSDSSTVHLSSQVEGEPYLDIVGIVDPLTRGAQLMASLVSTVMKVLPSKVRLYMNCVEKHSEMPMKSFFRYVLASEPEFEPETGSLVAPVAKFLHLPTEPILTMGLKIPENWLVGLVRSPYDLDNIRLKDVEGGVYGEYELENLLLEGHCFESGTGNPPRGLQFTLAAENQPIVFDTIVMANLGYFQLKGSPGSWILNLREGRSSELFQISSYDGVEVKPDSTGVRILMSSFRSNVVRVKVQKKPGMEMADLLADSDQMDEDSAGLWNRITDSISNSLSTGKKEDKDDEVINIFSLASGHLYERFLKIMMLSVVKHASVPVKFWFLKNYLSPSLKDFLPHMAAEYGFKYELVEYKWPRWLHQQTEKQRLIWGYKILFLDVLFPLDVKKIIFVDADQVVRTDLKELMDLDLEGNPYGYTPFCDSRTEMEGYRFWKQGYWRSHLQNRRYHISALYVVDLKKFRRIAAGDRLRGQYQGLSQDPNSLSNLDQDLPNNMIHQVGIKSLPQEWLWCETWCSDETKAGAKTIDLCNNPKTKEAKLSAAMRIIPEWKSYDDEMKALQERLVKGHGNTRKSGSARTADEGVGTAAHGVDVHSEL